MTIKAKNKELDALLDEVVLDLNKAFSSANQRLGKAEGKEESKEESKDRKKSPPVPEMDDKEGSEPLGEESVSAKPEASAPPEQPEAPAAEEQADPAEGGEGEMTPEALQAEYAKLPVEDIQMHIEAATKA